MQTFWLDDGLQSKVLLHSCVCLIDAKEFEIKLESTKMKDATLEDTTTADSNFPENELLLRQLIFADRILINKTDQLPADEEQKQTALDNIMKAIARVNTQAEIQ